MSKKRYQMDENAYPIAWRFNALDCLLSEIDKKGSCYLKVWNHNDCGIRSFQLKT